MEKILHHNTFRVQTATNLFFFHNLLMAIEADNEVRIIDAFVNQLDLRVMGFGNMNLTEEGRPAYHPSDLLKLYIYGYMNRTRSSRELEKETKRNLEVKWLIKGLMPDHNTISNFRRDNKVTDTYICPQFSEG